MEKEALIWSGFFMILGLVIFGGFKRVFTGNFLFEQFIQYKVVLGISFYLGFLFFLMGLIVFLFYLSLGKKKFRKIINK